MREAVPRALGSSLGASLGAWALEVVVVRLAARSVGIALPLSAGLVVLVTTNLMLAFPVAPPANLGTLELGATLGLLGFGVGMDRALAFALCYHTLQVVPVALLGGILAGRGGRTTRQARESC